MGQQTENLIFKAWEFVLILSLWGTLQNLKQQSEKIKFVLLKYCLRYHIKNKMCVARLNETWKAGKKDCYHNPGDS